jgi:phospholipase C
MPGPRVSAGVCCLTSIVLVLCGCGGGAGAGGSSSSFPTGSFQLSVKAAGAGAGTVSSKPSGIDCGDSCTASFSSGTQVSLTASPTANSFFAGWSGACSGTGTCNVTLTQNISVMANFSTSPVLTVALGGTGTGSVTSSPSGISCGQTCNASFDPNSLVTLTATAGTGSLFAGWNGGGCSGTGPNCTVTLSASEKVTATFNPIQSLPVLTVGLAGNGTGTVTSQPAGINCGTTCSASFAAGTQVTLTATAGANSQFVAWVGGGCSASPTCVVTLTASEKVTATFNLIQSEPVLSVILEGSGLGTVTSAPTGINCPQACSASFATGTQVTLSETPATNSVFAGWGGACSGTNSTCVVTLAASQQVTATFNASQSGPQLTVTLAGNSTGTVTSNPAGISCPPTCSASFSLGTQVTLTETPASTSYFAGWGEACSGFSATCVLTLNANETASGTFNLANLTAINHIIFMAQENRSFDHYLGTLRAYWAANNIPDQSLDGLPQFNPTSGIPPLYGPPPTNPGCDPAYPPPDKCTVDSNSPQIESFQLISQCVEDPGDAWDESHFDWNLFNPTSGTPALNGLVYSAAIEARSRKPPYYDTDGIGGMGYNDSSELNYYYFMATEFATSDRWFSPVMSRTPANRMYLDAATSQGYVYAIPTTDPPLTAPPIFEVLQNAGISWKIYVNPENSTCTGPPYQPSCLLTLSTIQDFAWGQTIPKDYPNNIAPMSEYFSDLQNNTLPQVAIIEPAWDAGFDEHPTIYDNQPSNIQLGANYVSTLINGLMTSSSWTDSVFILTYDEFGGFYDHVPAQQTVSPDGIKPVDLNPGDVCYAKSGPTCDFVYTGFRMPLIVVSPFTQKNYVSHTVADLTAILKLIETRFNLPPLTKRDAAQMDMTEFFNFNNPPWLAPPTPPAQNTTGACYVNKLP